MALIETILKGLRKTTADLEEHDQARQLEREN